MKRAKIFGLIQEFEDFLNRQDISIIDVKVQTVEQSQTFQEYFVGIVFYEDAPQDAEEQNGHIRPTGAMVQLLRDCRGHLCKLQGHGDLTSRIDTTIAQLHQ
jgi:hypothetical protein